MVLTAGTVEESDLLSLLIWRKTKCNILEQILGKRWLDADPYKRKEPTLKEGKVDTNGSTTIPQFRLAYI